MLRIHAMVSAHEVRPAYLELRQTATDTYDVLWKVPARGDNMRLGIYVEFPSGTTNVTTPRTSFANDASTERWSIKRPGGLTGSEIHITGLDATMTDVLVRDRKFEWHNSSNSSYPIVAVVCGSSLARRVGSVPHLPRARGRAHSFRR